MQGRQKQTRSMLVWKSRCAIISTLPGRAEPTSVVVTLPDIPEGQPNRRFKLPSCVYCKIDHGLLEDVTSIKDLAIRQAVADTRLNCRERDVKFVCLCEYNDESGRILVATVAIQIDAEILVGTMNANGRLDDCHVFSDQQVKQADSEKFHPPCLKEDIQAAFNVCRTRRVVEAEHVLAKLNRSSMGDRTWGC